jgi:hypothetical protein
MLNMIFQDAVGPDNIGGYDRVAALAEYLASLRDQSMALSNEQAAYIIRLWHNLKEYDKQPTVPRPRTQARLSQGRFKARGKSTVVEGVDSTKR